MKIHIPIREQMIRYEERRLRDKNIIHYNNLSLGEQNTIKERLLDIGSRPKLNYIKSENYEINKAKERKNAYY